MAMSFIWVINISDSRYQDEKKITPFQSLNNPI